MANETLARRYAQAIFDLAADAKRVAEVGRDLRTIWDAMAEEDTITRFFYAPVIDRAEKQKILLDAFSGKVEQIALHAILLLVRKRRERLFPEIVRQYASLEQIARGAEPLVIVSARRLPQAELDALVAKLSKTYNARFDVEQRVDPELLGGVRILMRDVAIDDTVAGKLEELGRTLLSSERHL